MEVGVYSLWGEAVNCWRLALTKADDLAVGRGDDSRLHFERADAVELRLHEPPFFELARWSLSHSKEERRLQLTFHEDDLRLKLLREVSRSLYVNKTGRTIDVVRRGHRAVTVQYHLRVTLTPCFFHERGH
jgi:hypothetical protein